MTARTVLNDSKTDVTTYTSGILDVGDLQELVIDIEVTDASGGTPGGCINVDNPCSFVYVFDVTRLTATGSLVAIGSVSFNSGYPFGETPVYPLGIEPCVLEGGFGDRIQVDLRNPEDIVLTFKLSMIGK